MADKGYLHCFSDDVLERHDATALAQLIRNGQLCAEEVMVATLRRIARVDDRLHAVAALDRELALAAALAAAEQEHSGEFAGVPILIKDNTDLRGFPTGHGSAAIEAEPASANDVLVDQILSQGLIAFGKSAMPEFGLNASTEHRFRPATPNPWNLSRSAGGSSGGAAALVSSGALAIAHAKDGGGSIRIPAACCGLVGMKPTRERLVTYRMAAKLPVNIVGDGVLTRSVRDTANFYAAAEQYYRNTQLPEIGRVRGPGSERLRVAVALDSPLGRCDEATREAVLKTARDLEALGHLVELVAFPADPGFPQDFATYWTMFAASLRFAGGRVMHSAFDSKQLNGLTKGLARDFLRHAYRLPGALRRLRATEGQMRSYFSGVDVLLTPVTSRVAPPLGYLDPQCSSFAELYENLFGYVAYTPLANASGVPAIALPCGFDDEHHLPVGVQLMAGHGQEARLLALAFALEDAQSWRQLGQSSVQSGIVQPDSESGRHRGIDISAQT